MSTVKNYPPVTSTENDKTIISFASRENFRRFRGINHSPRARGT